MQKQRFNEVEKYIISHFEEVVLLEDSLGSTRNKYRELLQQAQNGYPELDLIDDYFKANWATGSLVFSRKVWPRNSKDPGGLWIDNLRLEYLTSKSEDAPEAYVYAKPWRKSGVDVVSLKAKLWEQLPSILTREERKKCLNYEDDEDFLVGWPVAKKQEVLGWLMQDQSDRLVERIQDQVSLFTRFLPILNSALSRTK